MNYLDIILTVPIIWFGYRGLTRGLIYEVATLFALLAGIYCAIHFSYFVSDILRSSFNLTSEYTPLISFIITFIAVVIGVHLLSKIINKLVDMVALGILNKILGLVFGVVKCVFILSIVLAIFKKFDEKLKIIPKETKEHSLIYKPICKFAPAIFNGLDFDLKSFSSYKEKYNAKKILKDK